MIDLLCSLSRLAAASIVVVATLSHAQTAPLNDTGQTACYAANTLVAACDATTIGNTGTRPHQDARYGRDAAAAAGMLTKVGGGEAGFDFSCVLWSGTVVNGPICYVGLVANLSSSPSATPATDWACTKDNNTGRVWSLQSQGPVTWSDAAVGNAVPNFTARCGAITASTQWRLPTRNELLGIVHNGALTNFPISFNYFPSMPGDFHWTADTQGATDAWQVDFYLGESSLFGKTFNGAWARYVRNGQ